MGMDMGHGSRMGLSVGTTPQSPHRQGHNDDTHDFTHTRSQLFPLTINCGVCLSPEASRPLRARPWRDRAARAGGDHVPHSLSQLRDLSVSLSAQLSHFPTVNRGPVRRPCVASPKLHTS